MESNNIRKRTVKTVLFIVSSLCLSAITILFQPMRLRIFSLLVYLIITVYFCIKKQSFIVDYSIQGKDIFFAAFFEVIILLCYYCNIVNIMPQKVQKILSFFPYFISGHSRIWLLIFGFMLCVAGSFFASIVSHWLLCGLEIYRKIFKTYKVYFFVVLFIYLIAFIPIMLAEYYYTDDLGRTVYGYEITGSFSRYTADFLSKLLHGNSWLADIAPLAQLISLLLMAMAGVLILFIVSEFEEIEKWSPAALIPLGLSPYFLNVLSYRYDSPYMALSVFASIAPIVFYKRSPVKYSIAVFAGTVIMCTTYQVSSGIFPMMITFLILMLWINGSQKRPIFTVTISSLVGYISGLLVFRLLIMEPIGEDSYVDTSVSIKHLLPNLKTYFNYFNTDLPVLWKAAIITVLICFLIYTVKITKRSKAVTFVLTVCLELIIMVLIFGVYIVFANPLTVPRAFYGIGILLTLFGLPLLTCKRIYIGKIAVATLSWFFIVFSFIYGNTLRLQKEYIGFRTEQIINDLNTMEILKRDEPVAYQLKGSAGYPKAVKNSISEYPILERMIPVLLSDDSTWEWGSYQLKEYYGLEIIRDEKTDRTDQSNELELLEETYYYSIYSQGKTIIIDLYDTSE